MYIYAYIYIYIYIYTPARDFAIAMTYCTISIASTYLLY